MQDNIQNEIAKQLQIVEHSLSSTQMEKQNTKDETIKLYCQGREQILRYMHKVLTNLVSLIPTKEIKYYILKETDNIEDILKGVEQNEYGRNENTGNERSNTQED